MCAKKMIKNEEKRKKHTWKVALCALRIDFKWEFNDSVTVVIYVQHVDVGCMFSISSETDTRQWTCIWEMKWILPINFASIFTIVWHVNDSIYMSPYHVTHDSADVQIFEKVLLLSNLQAEDDRCLFLPLFWAQIERRSQKIRAPAHIPFGIVAV